MHTFNIRDLRQRTGQLVREAESGELSLVMKYGRPVFVAVPMNRRLLEHGVHEALAVKLYDEGVLSLNKAARLADLPVERFLQALAAADIDVVDYSAEELDQELEHFS